MGHLGSFRMLVGAFWGPGELCERPWWAIRAHFLSFGGNVWSLGDHFGSLGGSFRFFFELWGHFRSLAGNGLTLALEIMSFMKTRFVFYMF